MAEQKPRPLLVLADDDEAYTTSYGYFLEDLGFTVKCVMDKRSLLEAASAGRRARGRCLSAFH